MVCDVAMIIVSQKETAYFNQIKPQKKAEFANKKFKIALLICKSLLRETLRLFHFAKGYSLKNNFFPVFVYLFIFFLTGTIEQK